MKLFPKLLYETPKTPLVMLDIVIVVVGVPHIIERKIHIIKKMPKLRQLMQEENQ